MHLAVAPGQSCLPNVTVDKEICASTHVHDCQAGGGCPWVKQAPVGILGLLFANPHWRITVTNAGPVGITGTKVLDGAEQSCVDGTPPTTSASSSARACSLLCVLH